MAGADYTLAIETSNPTAGPSGRVATAAGEVLAGAGVALGRASSGPGGRADVVDEEPLVASGAGVDDLVSAIDRLCRRRGVTPREIGCVAVSIGPGGYTGLRSAVAAAKMIAEATGARVVDVPSAEVAARCIDPALAPALVCLASKADTAHATLLPAVRTGPWWERAEPALRSILGPGGGGAVEELCRDTRDWIAAALPIGIIGADQVGSLCPRALIADRYLPEAIRAASARVGAVIVEPIFAASSVLALAAGRDAVDPLRLAPIYPREPDAVTQWRQKVQRRSMD